MLHQLIVLLFLALFNAYRKDSESIVVIEKSTNYGNEYSMPATERLIKNITTFVRILSVIDYHLLINYPQKIRITEYNVY